MHLIKPKMKLNWNIDQHAKDVAVITDMMKIVNGTNILKLILKHFNMLINSIPVKPNVIVILKIINIKKHAEFLLNTWISSSLNIRKKDV